MLRLFLEDTQVDLENTTVKEFTELVHNFARQAVEYAVENGLDLSDTETMWYQAIQADILEASLKLTFKRLREKRLKNE